MSSPPITIQICRKDIEEDIHFSSKEFCTENAKTHHFATGNGVSQNIHSSAPLTDLISQKRKTEEFEKNMKMSTFKSIKEFISPPTKVELEEFPYQKVDSTIYIDSFSERLFMFFYAVCLTIMMTSFKYLLIENFKIASMCDIREWEEFQAKVEKKEIILISNVNCLEECKSFLNIFLTKLFECNYYILYSFCIYFACKIILKNQLSKKILYFMTISPWVSHFLGHVAFFNSKSYAFFLSSFIFSISSLIIAYQKPLYFKYYLYFPFCLVYFITIKILFENLYPWLLDIIKAFFCL